MRAAVLTGFNRPLEQQEVAEPEVRSGRDVIVKISGAGVCGSDVHLAEGALVDAMGAPAFPYVMGHENAGHVHAVGADVTSVAVGDPVLMHPHVTCGVCRACRRGDEGFCGALRFPGIDGQAAGGFAEYLRTTEQAVVKLPAGTDPTPMASLADAGLTAYHAVRRAVQELPPDGTAVVIGIGGVGYFALQLLRLFSPARRIAVDVNETKLARAAELGADLALVAGDDLVDRVRAATGGVGADLVIDCVGVSPAPEHSLAMLCRGGVLSVIGAGEGEVCCGTVGLTLNELTVRGNLVGTIGELGELAEIAVRERLQLIQTYYPLEDAERAFEDLRSGAVEGRAVLVPGPLPS